MADEKIIPDPLDERITHLESLIIEHEKEIESLRHENAQIRTMLNLEIDIRESIFCDSAVAQGRLEIKEEIRNRLDL